MTEAVDSIRIDSESDEDQVTSVVAVPPTWRDVWAILRGRYRPKVRRRSAVTLAGMDKVLREVWSPENLAAGGFRAMKEDEDA